MSNTAASDTPLANSRVILSAGTLTRASFRERVAAASSAGFNAISLFPQQYLAARRKERLSTEDMLAILSEHRISIDEIDPLLDWFGPGASTSELLMTEMAEIFGARSINAAAAFVSDRSLEEIADCFSRLCSRLATLGLRVDLEFLPWTGVDKLATALQVLEMADQPNGGVMFDCWHFFNSGDSLEDLRELDQDQAARITSLQLNDVPHSIPRLDRRQNWLYTKIMLQSMIDSIRVLSFSAFRDVALKASYPHPQAQKMMKDALCSRLYPDEGVNPIGEVLSILQEKGARPAIGLEVFNLDHEALSPEQIAQRAMQAYRNCLPPA